VTPEMVGVPDLLGALEQRRIMVVQPERTFVGMGLIVQSAPERDVHTADCRHRAVASLVRQQVHAL
jgi:hypothetical protein